MVAADKIAVLDFGGQYTQLIARRVRELSVYSEIFSCTHPIESILASGYKGIILSGGPSSVYEDGAPLPPKTLFDSGIPILGICYGMQAMGYLLGGHVVPAERREYGKAEVELQGSSRLRRGVRPDANGRVTVWMSRGDTVLRPPKGFSALGTTPNCPVAAMADERRKLYAVQFHPEVVHTPQGQKVFDNFLDICGVSRTWSMAGFIDTTVEEIRDKVGQGRVLCALSGGVDSSVVSVLVHRAIGDQLTCVFVDNGLLRKGEARRLGEMLGLAPEVVWRQPFPGPGLAIRVLGEVTPERLEILRDADAIIQDEVRAAGFEREVWQAFAVLLPIRTVGVMGDFRTYAHVIALRAVMSQDAMTADWARLPYELLGRISNRIINEVKGVNRVVFDISSKPPSTIEWE